MENKLIFWEVVVILRQIKQLDMKKNPKTQKVVKVFKCTCDNCELSKSQIFTK